MTQTFTQKLTAVSGSKKIALLHQKAQRYIAEQEYDKAKECCLSILKYNPQHADAGFLLGIIMIHCNKIMKAIEFIGRAIQIDQTKVEYYAQLARCLVLAKHDNEAFMAAQKALQLEPVDALTLDTLANVCSRLGEHEKAVEIFQRVVGLDPDNAQYHYNLASSLRFVGDFTKAEEVYEKAIDLNPNCYQAHAALSGLKKQSVNSNHIPRLQKFLGSKDLDKYAEISIRHALAKEYEDLEDYDNSYKQLHRANSLHKSLLKYDIDDDSSIFKELLSAFTKQTFNMGLSGYDSSEAIFILGMPRTGTTLVERILSSHSEVQTAGELQNFGLCLKKATATGSKCILDVETIQKGLRVDFYELGQKYIESTRPVTGKASFFIDKLPLNFFYIGFIALALPNARIIVLKRNPMDTCFSNYKQLFAMDYSYYNYSYDLQDVGKYYSMFKQLMCYWEKILPGKIHEIGYENLVCNQEEEISRLLNHCGLEWQEQCHTFYKNKTPVSTASAVQVRQSIYTSSVNKWKKFKPHLQPLEDVLQKAGIELA